VILEKVLVLILLFLPFQLGRHFWPESAYLFGLKIDYLSPTLYLQDLLVILAIFLNRSKIIFFLKSRLKLLTAYCLLLIANVLISLSPLSSFFAWLRISEFIILAIIASQNSKLVWQYLNRFLPFYVLLETALGIGQLIKQASVSGFFWFMGERTFNIFTPGISRGSWMGKIFLRPYGSFSHPNSLAGFILVCLILLLGKSKLRCLDKIALLSGTLLIIFTFSRVVWLTASLLGLIYLLTKLQRNIKFKSLRFDFSYLIIALLIPLFVYLFSKTTNDLTSLTIRMKLANTALVLIRQSPIFGIGANSFILGLAKTNSVWEGLYWLQPVHNIFLLVASETGLVGLSLFVGFLVLTTRRLLYRYIVISAEKRDCEIARYRPELTGERFTVLIALLTILFTGLFDHYWLTLIQNQLLFVLILALSWGHKVIKSDSEIGT